jgi:hypothetical protein
MYVYVHSVLCVHGACCVASCQIHSHPKTVSCIPLRDPIHLGVFSFTLAVAHGGCRGTKEDIAVRAWHGVIILCMIAITLKIRSAPRLLQVLRDRKKLELRPRVYLVPSSAVFCILIPERIHHLLVWYGSIIKVVSYVLLCTMYIGGSSKQKAKSTTAAAPAAPQQQRLRRRHHK